MKECCMSCKFCKYEKDNLYPVRCKKGRPSLSVEKGYEYICDDYRTPSGEKRTTLTKEELEKAKEILMKGVGNYGWLYKDR